MSRDRCVISSKKALLEHYSALQTGDIVCGRIPLRPGEDHLLLDLTERGVRLIPSATSQLASRSKAYQALLYKSWMVPGTTAIYGLNHLLEQVNAYNKQNYGRVVLKQDRKNAGLGVLLYGTIEDIYNQAANDILSYPFVIQPYIEESRDIRVIILGDYVEAYQRENSHNFRNNLHCGGASSPYFLNDNELALCRKVMERGKFPYAHLDLMTTGDGTVYLAEINLRGGIHGAVIDTKNYKKKVKEIEDALIKA